MAALYLCFPSLFFNQPFLSEREIDREKAEGGGRYGDFLI